MNLEFDSNKNSSNFVKHGLSFNEIAELNWDFAVTKLDSRVDYGEIRYLTYALLNDRICALIWTMRGNVIRPISFRKANVRERKIYEKEKNTRS